MVYWRASFTVVFRLGAQQSLLKMVETYCILRRFPFCFLLLSHFGLVLTFGDASRTRRVNFRSKKSSYAAPQNRQNNILIEKKN